ncbi:serine/threonine protein kinase [Nitzschia inconspicua]|uniref:Serine/threonine protein kinase n=1 Tax=Nitzschia inconspicua TaxID=303405 RepID=A0A9K3K726_9STRA|nr:serine/threonine protein kinase [Nitzschia inconspicua]KAG7371248.1 serine/threonine protein kinase [Nitzschia inconspicua]
MATVDVLQRQPVEDDETISVVPSSVTTACKDWLLQRTNLSSRHDLSKLVKLELAHCNLTSLPDELSTLLPNMEILFCPQNPFVQVPTVIGKCPKLRMVSFKECQVEWIPPEALQPQLQWLILTGNRLREIPETIGRCVKLQKCMLSGNRLEALPFAAISKLQHLELIRLACNQLKEAPMELLRLSNLRWAAFASNPFLQTLTQNKTSSSIEKNGSCLPILDDPTLDDTTAEILGKGAGGVTRKVYYQDRPVAVKTFVGEITSDGSPQDEKAINVAVAALQNPALIELLGETLQGALVMEFLDGYQALAGPPSFDTCTRDVYPENISGLVSPEFAWTIVSDLLRVLNQLHGLGICHADFYAHNILIHPALEKVKLSDYGAAFYYDVASDYGKAIQGIELKAYVVLVQELFDLIVVPSLASQPVHHPWMDLLEQCQKPNVTFAEIHSMFGATPNP